MHSHKILLQEALESRNNIKYEDRTCERSRLLRTKSSAFKGSLSPLRHWDVLLFHPQPGYGSAKLIRKFLHYHTDRRVTRKLLIRCGKQKAAGPLAPSRVAHHIADVITFDITTKLRPHCKLINLAVYEQRKQFVVGESTDMINAI